MQNDWPLALLLVLISPAVGSFLGVFVDRWPKGVSVLAVPSRCGSCNTKILWRDMVPVVSAMALGGRCRSCTARIPGHLMRIELAAVIAAVLVVLRVPGPVEMWLVAAILWCLIALFYSDLLCFRLPDVLTLALFVLGMALAATDPARGWLDGLISAGAASGAFWLIRWGYFQWRGKEGLGLGDVKLMAGIGAAVGWQLVPLVTLVAAGLAILVVVLEAFRVNKVPRADARLPFGTYLTAATGVILML